MPIGKRGGSNPGERRGGRKKGSENVSTRVTKIAAERGILAAQRMRVTPLEVLLTVVQGGVEANKITDRQLGAAVAAAPYCHARLAAVQYVPPPDASAQNRRVALAGLNYQQRKQIEGILLAAALGDDDGTIEGDVLQQEDADE